MPGMPAFWKVRVWDQGDRASAYSEVARWEMGLLDPSDWAARWIADPRLLPEQDEDLYKVLPAPMFRREFTLSRPVRRARAYVSGLGYYELSLNGRRVGDHLLDPGWTSYERRVLYSTYDVTDSLQPGVNCAGILLGNGWYNPLPLRLWGWLNLRQHLAVGRPRAILQLVVEYQDGGLERVVTDESWKVGDGPILKNNIYLGEVYDARRERPGWDRAGFDDREWRPAALAPEPLGLLRAQMVPPIRVARTIRATRVTEPAPGVFIFDLGENIGGQATLRVRGEAGTEVRLRYGELLHANGSLNVMTSVCGQIKGPGVGGPGAPDVAFQGDIYVLKGGGPETFTPRFTFHGFRYVEVTGYPGRPGPDAIEGRVLHSGVDEAGAFTCSNPMFNRIQEITRRTLLSNLFSVQSDCPHRERFGYGGDMVASSEMAMFNLDMASFYAKAVNDLADAVRPNGGMTETAPFVGIDAFQDGLGGGGGPRGWGTGHPVLLWNLYQYYGDRRLLAEQLPLAIRWMEFLDDQAQDLFVERGIGDHESIAPKFIPLTSTAFYYLNADLVSRIARVLGRSQVANRYADRAAAIKAAFNRRFLDRQTGRYANGTQASQAFPLYLDLAPSHSRAMILKALLDDVEQHDGHLTTGIFGTKFLLDVLTANGRADVAYRIVNQRTFPGWGHMLEGGATTLWEHWEFSDNVFSHNHPMFGSVSEWFFKALAGIQPAPDAVGFDRVTIRPAIVPDLSWVKARYDSVRGPVVSEWRVENGRLTLHVVLPPNASGLVRLPTTQIKEVREADRPVQQSHGVELRSIERDELIFAIGSGDYTFTLPAPAGRVSTRPH
jgi:alpha-L-rhamnosidase